MNEPEKYRGYLEDLIPIIWDMITDARENENDQLFAGDLWVYYQTLSFLQQEFAYLAIPLSPMGMKDIGNVEFVYENIPEEIDPMEFKTVIQKLVLYLRKEEKRIVELKLHENEFVVGQVDGIYSILSMMKEQAEFSFELPLEDLGLMEVELSIL